jgi:iron complex outermembrane receptor protein
MKLYYRSLAAGLLASSALATPALGQTVASNAPPKVTAQVATDGTAPDPTEIIVTAQKRSENLSKVPISIQAIGTKRLDQLNISNFEQYTKQLPSVSFQTSQPGVTVVYMRGVASGGDGNHSGSLPSVGTYLDEQPVTTIGGTLDIHIYDIARIESLAGPQGTLYGASSEAGTIRIITNKPELGVTSGRIDAEVNTVAHGGQGGKLEGMINLPIADRIAFRGVGFYQHDAGYIDNIAGSRTYYVYASAIPDLTVTNAGLVKKNFNDQDIYGGRAALKIDLDDNWTVTPTILHQNLKANGYFGEDPTLGEYKTQRFFDEIRKDKFTQAALTVQGKIGNFDVTYASAYLDRRTHTQTDYTDYSDAYDRLYAEYGSGDHVYGGLGYFYYQDSNGNYIDPRQKIVASDHFRKMSQEFRIASPADKPFRVIAGAFYQRQSNDIFQDYQVAGLAPNLSVNGRPGTLWLTKQKRVDKDYALFGEASYDFSPQLTLTAGGRLFKYDNSLIGFFGFGRDPNGPPYNGGGSSRTGVAGCLTTDGSIVRDGTGAAVIAPVIDGTPCTNLGVFANGSILPKRIKGSGFTHRLNLQYKPHDGAMFYATWSRGFRPGGINRRQSVRPYDADYLTNWELGWKLAFDDNHIRWNGAIYQQKWAAFQYAFLGPNSFTEIHNGSDARIRGIESDVSYVGGGFNFNAAASYTDAKTRGDICFYDTPAADCSTNPSNPDLPNFVSAPKGTRLPITPKFKATATARYSWPVMGNAKAHVQAAIAYQSSAAATLRQRIALVGPAEYPLPQVNPNSYLGRIKSSTTVDAAIGIDFRAVTFELYAQNLLDEHVELSRGVACGSCTSVSVIPGTPRTVGLRAGYKF